MSAKIDLVLSEWISVKDKHCKPPKYTSLLVTDGTHVWIAFWQNPTGKGQENWVRQTFDSPTYKVTHWMPLPVPPRKKTKK